jgi:hypothetical protein
MQDVAIPPDTPELWKSEVAFLRDVLISRVIEIVNKIHTLQTAHDIDDPIVQEIYNDLGFIAGLLQDDYGFDGTVQ